jgi:transcriptional regulator with XRE-family HTH domain
MCAPCALTVRLMCTPTRSSGSIYLVMTPDDFGGRLRARRTAASLSQEELAEQSGVSVRTISDLERGRTRWPHPGSVHRLADALQLTGPARTEFISAAGRRPPRPAHGTPKPAGDGRVVPRQLPLAVPTFAGRSTELAILSRVLARPGGTAVITAIGGTAGVGKPKPEANTSNRYQTRQDTRQSRSRYRGCPPRSEHRSALGNRPGRWTPCMIGVGPNA